MMSTEFETKNIRHATTKLFTDSGNIQPVAIKLTQGLDLIFHDYNFDNYRSAISFSDKVIRLDFAYSGSVNLIKNNHETIFLEPGFLKLSQSSDDRNNYSTVGGHYRGVTILLDRQKISSEFLSLLENKLLLDDIVTDYLQNDDYILVKTEFIERFFQDVEKVKLRNRVQFLLLRVAELLLYLDSEEAHESVLPKMYFTVQEIKKIYAIRTYLLENMSERATLKQLANKYDIGLTTMQKLFKATYYQSIHSFVLSARLEKACYLLKDSEKSITFIANEVGYINASKFSAFFKDEKGLTPKMYRKLYKN
ncbi:helix-turn-helix domain-containing protein [Leuconostoc suionicum]|uniref:helix-turn-helix domain-containing protein n=1 Tax=Leuconostoc suionicum TaxID=1511761 RepID=UPI001B8C5715|nr:AraC family transcriptional regulator [Leuconostoc suionicum]MBS1008252.1 helix-turn-helix transcriptional regulator [Leuconostoc suionicum]